MTLHDGPFQSIANKRKDIEMRLYDEKRKQIQKEDIIEFENVITKEKIMVIVIDIHIFENFEELYNNFSKERIGYLPQETANPKDMEKYYSKEAISKNKVVGIEIKLI